MTVAPLRLTSGWGTTAVQIRQQDITEVHKTLGVYMTPNGDETAQVRALLEKSCRISTLVLTSKFSKMDTIIAYRMMWYPAVGYSLGMTTMSPSQLSKIQQTATQSFLAKMGLNRNYPLAVTFGPIEYGGLALPDLSVEQGIQQLQTFMLHMLHQTGPGKLITICLQTLQVEAGTAIILLQEPTVEFSYLSPVGCSPCNPLWQDTRFSYISPTRGTYLSLENGTDF